VVLVALFLVNLPFVHETLTERQITRSGREVEATVLKTGNINGRHFVDYVLPRSVDESRTTFSARVDDATYEQARESKVIAVRVVPGDPAANRPVGEVRSRLFAVVALVCDAVLLLAAVLFWRRWRRFSLHEVVTVQDGTVTLTSRRHTLTVSGPEGWVSRVRPGDRASGSMHLVADGDVLPGPPLGGLEQVHGSSYVVRGRVVGARSGRVELELDDGFRIVVETRGHRIRADIRDSTEVRGTLCFTPTVSRD
jgi:hypothetical protein